MENSLDWEEGFRAGIHECLKRMIPSEYNQNVLNQLTVLYEISAARTDQILCEMENSEDGTS